MSGAGTVQYAITFTPERYRIETMHTQVGQQTIPYWAIVSEATRQPVAFSYDENVAKTLCLSLELIRAQVYGDKSKVTQLMKLIDKLSFRSGAFKES